MLPRYARRGAFIGSVAVISILANFGLEVANERFPQLGLAGSPHSPTRGIDPMATSNTTPAPPQSLTFQGIVVPGSSLNPQAFFAGTRRQYVLQKTLGTWGGFGNTDVVDTLRSGILSGYYVKLSGNLVITLGGGTCATTARWPYYLLRSARFQANGQSNLVNADGWALRAREFMSDPEINDRGVSQGIGGASPGTARTQGTLSMASEAWGVGSNVTAIAGGTYDVELTFYVPVAYEKKMLTGAVFCQTLSTTLELDLDWANLTDLFILTGAATAVFTPTVTIEAEMFTIPSDGKGGMFLPNLSAFHSYIQNRAQPRSPWATTRSPWPARAWAASSCASCGAPRTGPSPTSSPSTRAATTPPPT